MAASQQYLVTSVDADGVGTPGAVTGLGYTTGQGASVEQASSRTTGVTINALTGRITLVSAAGSTTPASFTVTNSYVTAKDVVVVSQQSGTDKYDIGTDVADGSFIFTSRTFSGTTTEQPTFNFIVLKGAIA